MSTAEFDDVELPDELIHYDILSLCRCKNVEEEPGRSPERTTNHRQDT